MSAAQPSPRIPLPATSNIPKEMQECPSWVNWMWGTSAQGKMTKIPVNPHTGGKARSNDATTWSAFPLAYTKGKASLGTRGLGFMFTDDFIGIDLDAIVAEEQVLPWAQVVLDRFATTYVEWSPSRTGFHLYFRGMLPQGHRKKVPIGEAHGKGKQPGAEIYGQGSPRFFTVTGQKVAWSGSSLSFMGESDVAWYLQYIAQISGIRAGAECGQAPNTGAKFGRLPANDAGAKLDFDYDGCLVSHAKLLRMYSIKEFTAHWTRESKKKSDSERGLGLAWYCHREGWTPQETCAALNTWCDETEQARYHHTKMRMTLEKVFTREEEHPKSREDAQGWIAKKLGLVIERIVQYGDSHASYAVYLGGRSTPETLASFVEYEKRLTWKRLAFQTAASQGTTLSSFVGAKEWDTALGIINSIVTYEPLDATHTEEETAEWISAVLDDHSPVFPSFAVMSEHDRDQDAFYIHDTEEGHTGYLKLDALLRALHIGTVGVTRNQLIAQLAHSGWAPCKPTIAGKQQRYWKRQTAPI